jgi:uncharacterized protein involved in cysteine biosynthesis
MDHERRGPVRDLLQGALAVPRGLAFLARTKGAMRAALGPAAAGVVLWVALTAVGAWGVAALTGAVVQGTGVFATLGRVVVDVAGFVLASLLAALVAFAVAQPLSRSALDRLASDLGREIGAPSPAMPSSHLGLSLKTALGAIGFALPSVGLLELLTLFVPEAAVVTEPLVPVVTGLAFAWDLFDHPMSRQGMSWRERLAWMRANAALVLGFALSAQLLLLVPGLDLFSLPVGVLGATRLLAARRPELPERPAASP